LGIIVYFIIRLIRKKGDKGGKAVTQTSKLYEANPGADQMPYWKPELDGQSSAMTYPTNEEPIHSAPSNNVSELPAEPYNGHMS